MIQSHGCKSDVGVGRLAVPIGLTAGTRHLVIVVITVVGRYQAMTGVIIVLFPLPVLSQSD